MEWMLLHLVQILPEKMPASCASFLGYIPALLSCRGQEAPKEQLYAPEC